MLLILYIVMILGSKWFGSFGAKSEAAVVEAEEAEAEARAAQRRAAAAAEKARRMDAIDSVVYNPDTLPSVYRTSHYRRQYSFN